MSLLLGQALQRANIPFVEASGIHRVEPNGVVMTVTKLLLCEEKHRAAALVALGLSFERLVVKDGAVRVATPEEISEWENLS